MWRRVAPAIAFLVWIAIPTHVALADLQGELGDVQERMDSLREEILSVETVRGDMAAAVLATGDRLDQLAAELREAEVLLAQTDAELAATEAAVADVTERISVRTARIEDLLREIAATRSAAVERAVELYMAAEPDAVPLFASDAERPGVDVVYADRVQTSADRVVATLRSLRELTAREVERLEDDRAVAEQYGVELEDQRLARRDAAAAVAATSAEVEAELVEQIELLGEIEAEIAHIEGEIDALAREEARIAELIRQEQAQAGPPPGILLRPVPGGVSSGFGIRVHPIYGNERLHTGWDMNGGCGQPILASGDGRVFLAGWFGGYGNAVMIDHGGGMATLYAHQSSLAVTYGQQVSTGEVVGWVGTTGLSTGCHLHWEVRLSGTPVDPTPYV